MKSIKLPIKLIIIIMTVIGLAIAPACQTSEPEVIEEPIAEEETIIEEEPETIEEPEATEGETEASEEPWAEEIVEETTIKDKIAFVSDRDGNMKIYIMNIDGSEQVRLTNNPEWDFDPCFSPDGSKIAFASERTGNYEIYIMNIDGSGQTNLTNNPACDGSPCFFN
jgi:WD40 repeat protein